MIVGGKATGGSSAGAVNEAESQRIVMRALCEGQFLNNLLYQSDFNDERFNSQAGVTCITTREKTFLGSR